MIQSESVCSGSVKRLIYPKSGYMIYAIQMASVGLLLNVGDKYMMERGGWSSAGTMKNVYEHTMKDGANAADNLINNYYNSLLPKD